MKKLEIPDVVCQYLKLLYSGETDRELVDEDEFIKLQDATFNWLMGIDRYEIYEHEPKGQNIIMQLFFDGDHLNALVENYIDAHGFENLAHNFMEEVNTYSAIIEYLKLIPAIASQKVKIPEKVLNLHRESRGCFVHGYYSASIILSRSIIEFCLKELLGEHDAFNRELTGLLERAHKKEINTNAYGVALKIKNTANDVVHQRNYHTSKAEAQGVLDQTKVFLEEVFSSNN